ncbi:hypothetical protein Gogos_005825 [Gossypium gossypioides]|uniref:Uncharacterized protein n=1 Tax=Gossypium gossypioides TaxID=34282 RepID=A0A7J9C3X4_GOSGO|nr:hypothetical protein [Gossypium gossypioides]
MTYCHYGHCYCGRCHRPSSPLPFSVLLFLALALMLLALSSLIKIEIDMESTGDSMTWLVLLAALAILVVVRFLSANSCRQPHYCGCGRFVKVEVRGRAGCLVLEVIFAECPEEEANASQTKPL